MVDRQTPPDRPANRTGHAAIVRRAVWTCIALGVLIRVLRYAVNPPMWADEAMLASSFRARGYAEMLTPLDFFQVSPAAYLWATLGAVRALGFNEYALRSVGVACAVASVPLFAWVARGAIVDAPLARRGARVAPAAWVLAVAVFAVSYYPVRYAAEVKPYAVDLLASLLLTAGALAYERRRGEARWLWALAAGVPVAIAFSYPAVFVAGGVAAALVLAAWRDGNARTRVAHAALCVCIIAAFAANYAFVVTAQFDNARPATMDYWADEFPPLLHGFDPLGLVVWFFRAHCGRMFGYPIGGSDGGSVVTFVCFVIGCVVWWRAGLRTRLAVLLMPFALLFIAAALHRYPYGGSGRVSQHAVPAICLLMGVGLAQLLMLAKTATARRRGVRIVAGVLVALGVAQGALAIAGPYRYVNDADDRALARELWRDAAGPRVVVCGVNDLRLPWLDRTWSALDGAKYVSNQWVHSARHRAGEEPAWDAVSMDRPLWVVMPAWPDESRGVVRGRRRWLAVMASRYDLVATHEHGRVKPEGAGHTSGWWVVVYEFVPRTGRADG